jgi:hypothetical protein
VATIQAAILAATGLLVASCGREVATLEATPGPSVPPTSAPATPTAPPTEWTERPKLPSKDPQDPYAKRTFEIKSANVDKRDAKQVTLTYDLPSPCSAGLDRADVVEQPGSVVVTLIRKPDKPAKDQPICAQVIQEKTTTVKLDEELADRKLIDGSTMRPVIG